MRQTLTLAASAGLAVFSALPAAAQVSGVIRDAVTLLPIAGARIGLQTTAIVTFSAADGTWALPDASGSELKIVGAHKGFFNASVVVASPASAVELLVSPVPADDDPSYTFVEPSSCGNCHADQFEQWNGSAMAQAGDNTWVYDIYNGTGTPGGMGGFVYTRDSAFAEHNPNSECASCHQPEPWSDEPFIALEDIGSLSDGALHGISCEVCHKIADIDESKKNFPGLYPGVTTLTRPAGPAFNQVMYGVLGDVDYTLAPLMRPSYQPQLVAAVCGACHQDKNDPDEDGDFEEANGVISEPTYLEWLDSPYGDPDSPQFAACVNCHMPAYGSTRACNVVDVPRDPDTIRSHRIEGTTAQFLDNAVELTLSAVVVDGRIDVEVVIDNTLTGHHVPTGVTVRNMILVIDAWRLEDDLVLADDGTQIIHDLGGIGNPVEGYYAGLPGKFFAKINHDASGSGPTFFTDATGILSDTRIPALETDTTVYSFDLPGDGGTFRVRARLIYRRAFRFLVDAKAWTEDGHGNPLEDVAPPHYGHLMEEANWTSDVIVVGDPSAVPAVYMGPARPNPTRGATEVALELARAMPLDVAVFDLSGRLVRTLHHGAHAAGSSVIVWDGRDDRNVKVGSSAYVVRVRSEEGTESRRVVLVR